MNKQASSRDIWIGVAAGLGSVAVASGWQLASRHAVTTTLGPYELALLRYMVPAALLVPLMWRARGSIAGKSHLMLALIVVGSGAPFGLAALAGTVFAPAANMGIFIAGAMPLFTAMFAVLFAGEKPSGYRAFGLAMMVTGIVMLGANSVIHSQTDAWRGDLLFLLAAALWAIYTVAFRASGLTPWQGAALVNVVSALLLAPVLLVRGSGKLLLAPLADVLTQVIAQGVVAGVLGWYLIGLAIQKLGASRAASFGALVPVVTAIGAALLLGEAITLAVIVSAALVAVGVLVTNARTAR